MPKLHAVVAVASVLSLGYAAWLLTGWGGPEVIGVVDAVGLVGFAAFGAVSAVVAGARTYGTLRAAWTALGVGAASWAAGEALWAYADLTAVGHSFPSFADVGFLGFLIGATVCLGCLLSAHPRGTQLRLALDGVIVGAAVFCTAWVTVFSTLVAAHGGELVDALFVLIYPMVGIGLVTVAALMLARASRRRRPSLALVTGGLVLILVSDLAYAYLTIIDGLGDNHALAIGWAWGFVCLGIGALASPRFPRDEMSAPAPTARSVTTWLPYLPVAVAAVVCAPVLFSGLGAVFVAAAVTVLAVMIRQILVIAENRRLLMKVAEQALRDPLTGLANRTSFQDRLTFAVQLHQRHFVAMAVLVLDLDRFTAVNDEFGHDAGDALLTKVAERLTATVRSTDIVARLGGDEFAVLVEGDADTATALARRVVMAFERPFVISDEDVMVRPSVGLAMAPAETSDLTGDELLRRADTALRSAKRSPTEHLVIFESGEAVTPTADRGAELILDEDGNGPAAERLLAELRHAIEHFELSVVYQPKFDLRTYSIVGLEALVRWPHPRRGLLTPQQFLPLVRQHGLMRSLTSVVLELALDDAARWHARGVGVPVAINVFAPAISDPELPRQIVDALQRRRLPPGSLTVEITEDLLLDNLGKTRMVFNKLRDNGIRVAIDDFGTGYSALWYLREFPVDEVKLDREFIAPVLTHPASAAIVRAVVDLSHALGVTPVAEGVENTETATQLLDYGCEIAQGYLFSPPLPPSSVGKLLTAQKRGLVAVPSSSA